MRPVPWPRLCQPGPAPNVSAAAGAGTLKGMNKTFVAGIVCASVLIGSGCSSDTRQSVKTDVQSAVSDVANAGADAVNNAAEAVTRNLATQQGEEQFNDAGKPLQGPLTCQAKT